MIDALLKRVIEASLDSPPANPVDGAVYRVGGASQGDWTSQEGNLAVRVSGVWQYVEPFDGLTVFDRNADAMLYYRSGWQSAVEPVPAAGGPTIDTEARQMLADLVEALRMLGVFPNQT